MLHSSPASGAAANPAESAVSGLLYQSSHIPAPDSRRAAKLNTNRYQLLRAEEKTGQCEGFSENCEKKFNARVYRKTRGLA